eukprot:2789694-Prymnesium_polylepis.1
MRRNCTRVKELERAVGLQCRLLLAGLSSRWRRVCVMRFGRALREAQVPQWRSFYCDYDRLQQLVLRCSASRAADEAKARHAAEQAELLQDGDGSPARFERPMSPLNAITTACNADVDFVTALAGQIDHAEEFYRAQLEELMQRSAVLLEQARCVLGRGESFGEQFELGRAGSGQPDSASEQHDHIAGTDEAAAAAEAGEAGEAARPEPLQVPTEQPISLGGGASRVGSP